MSRYAAVDIGSNSIRMLAAEMAPGQAPAILAAERQVTRLGSSTFRTGRIDPQAMSLTCDVLRKMAQQYKKVEVVGARAVATSAVRDASNQREFLARASEALGTEVEIISGQEEARLIQLGVESRWPQRDKRVLIVDVGGGSAELILAENARLVEAFSKPLGAVRMTEVFLKNDPPSELELHRLEEYIEEKLAVARRRIGSHGIDRVIATSATAAAIVCAVCRVSRSRREVADRLRTSAAEVRRFYKDVSRRDLEKRRKVPGIGPRRAEIIVAGTAVFVRVLNDFQLPSLYYSAAGVRDGIIADLAARGVGRELSRLSREQRHRVEEMARKYGVAVPHARKVADLAAVLFDSLQPLHRLSPDFGKLLEAASYLHDAGHYISSTGHHKHSFYLVANSDLAGFTDLERRQIALLCRYHRKSMPTARHDAFQDLNPEARRAVLLLTPLLRLADSLDRSHDQRIDSLQCQLRDGEVVVSLRSEADTDLELWAGERAADVFREVYSRPLTLVRN